MHVLLFRGKGVIAKAIQWQTRSEYSHAAIEIDGIVFESQYPHGVRKTRPCGDYDKYYVEPLAGTIAHEVSIPIKDFLISKLGMPYDYMMIARFISRRPASENGRWFCSELVMEAFRYIGIDLLNCESHYASPRDLSISPLLVKVL